MRFYLKASCKGNHTAKDNNDQLFERGFGVLQEDTEALKYYKKLAEGGNKNGQLHLEIMCLNGEPNLIWIQRFNRFKKLKKQVIQIQKYISIKQGKARSLYNFFQ